MGATDQVELTSTLFFPIFIIFLLVCVFVCSALFPIFVYIYICILRCVFIIAIVHVCGPMPCAVLSSST